MPPCSLAIACTASACSTTRACDAVEFEEHRRRDAVVRLLVLVDRAHRLLADDVAARDRDARLDGLDHGVGAAVDRVEGADRGRHRFLHRVQAHRDLGDDAERALRADEEAREVVARGGFFRAARGLDDAPVGEHHFQRQHVLAHRAVAHRVGARGARRRHAAERRVGAGIDREEQARVLDVLVQLLARDAGLHHRVEVLLRAPRAPGSSATDRCTRRPAPRGCGLRARCRRRTGIIGTRWRRQMLTTSRTSSVVFSEHHRIGKRVGK